MSFLELARQRYSTRAYKDSKVEDKKLEMILEAGRIAPTAHNSQPVRIKVITSEDELAKVDECTPCRFGAPLVLLVCFDKDICWKRSFDSKSSGQVDASIVTTQMMYMAQELELSSCWVMHFNPFKTIEVFSLPDNLEAVAFLPIGYASEDAVPSASHSKRNAVSEMLI